MAILWFLETDRKTEKDDDHVSNKDNTHFELHHSSYECICNKQCCEMAILWLLETDRKREKDDDDVSNKDRTHPPNPAAMSAIPPPILFNKKKDVNGFDPVHPKPNSSIELRSDATPPASALTLLKNTLSDESAIPTSAIVAYSAIRAFLSLAAGVLASALKISSRTSSGISTFIEMMSMKPFSSSLEDLRMTSGDCFVEDVMTPLLLPRGLINGAKADACLHKKVSPRIWSLICSMCH